MEVHLHSNKQNSMQLMQGIEQPHSAGVRGTWEKNENAKEDWSYMAGIDRAGFCLSHKFLVTYMYILNMSLPNR